MSPRQSNKRKHDDDDRDSGPLVSKKSRSSQGPSAVEAKSMNISWSGYITISGSVQAMGRNASVWNYASMFNRDSKHETLTRHDTGYDDSNEHGIGSQTNSGVYSSKLRGTYMKQLTERRNSRSI